MRRALSFGSPGPAAWTAQHAGYARCRERYLIAFEKSGTGYSAHSPEVPGCIGTGRKLWETWKLMQSAMASHIPLCGATENGSRAPDRSLNCAEGVSFDETGTPCGQNCGVTSPNFDARGAIERKQMHAQRSQIHDGCADDMAGLDSISFAKSKPSGAGGWPENSNWKMQFSNLAGPAILPPEYLTRQR